MQCKVRLRYKLTLTHGDKHLNEAAEIDSFPDWNSLIGCWKFKVQSSVLTCIWHLWHGNVHPEESTIGVENSFFECSTSSQSKTKERLLKWHFPVKIENINFFRQNIVGSDGWSAKMKVIFFGFSFLGSRIIMCLFSA